MKMFNDQKGLELYQELVPKYEKKFNLWLPLKPDFYSAIVVEYQDVDENPTEEGFATYMLADGLAISKNIEVSPDEDDDELYDESFEEYKQIIEEDFKK